MRPASAADQTLPPPPVRTTGQHDDADESSTRPAALRRPICSPKNRNATIAVKGTAIALVMAPIPAGARSAATQTARTGSPN